MIHRLEISPDKTPAELRKLARRYGMTGGYELELKEGLNEEELAELKEIYSAELDKYEEGTSAYRSSLAYRILGLI